MSQIYRRCWHITRRLTILWWVVYDWAPYLIRDRGGVEVGFGPLGIQVDRRLGEE
jgi:hypothetical protein